MTLCRDFPYYDNNIADSLNNSYTCTNDSASGGLIQNIVGFNNDGDAVPVRRPNGSFYHGFSFGDITAANFGFNIPPVSGGNQSYLFGCGDWFSASNFDHTNANNQSPGEANSIENSILIQNIRNGNFDYKNPNRLDHCAVILNARVAFFEGKQIGDQVELNWQVDARDLSEVSIERKSTTNNFQPLASFVALESNQYYLDPFPLEGKNIYRLKLQDIQGGISYSDLVEVWLGNQELSKLFPNPSQNQLFLEFASPAYRKISLLNALGQEILATQVTTESHASLSLRPIPEGVYWVRIIHENGRQELQKIVKR